jgi:uncharacterized protein DUF1761
MDMSLLLSVNYFAIIVSAIIYFLIGSLWFSTLFGSLWTQELQRHNVVIKEPTTREILSKMLQTFLANIITAYAMAVLVTMTGSTTILSGLFLGILAAVGCAATTLGAVFTWESRSLKLFLIDIGYPALGIIASAILLSVWQ